MRKLILFLFTLGLIWTASVIYSTESNAQIFGNKMPIGTKVYEAKVEVLNPTLGKIVVVGIPFLDTKGEFESYNFNLLSVESQSEYRVIVYDTKLKEYRLAITPNEAMGLAEFEGEEPPKTYYVEMKNIKQSTRQRIE